MFDFEKPRIEIAEISEDKKYGRFVVEPLERGYGTTLGNSLRRIMLSSLPGAAVSQVKIEGVLHEFSSIPGVKEDVTEIINACDAGREGELIFRNMFKLSECRKPVKRLWISSMEDEAIRKGFENLKPSEMYDNLYYSADARAKADWLVGINLTRLFSVLYHRKLCIGRVVTPTLALIISREAERTEFVPETYYNAQITCGKLKATSERLSDKAEAEKIIAECSNQLATVISVNGEEREEKAPLLYDLTTLQRDANRILGYTAQQTLDYAQSLYEKKLCTYPRTDSRFLTDDMMQGVNAIALCAAGICDENPPVAMVEKQVCNSKKVSDHHAIIPTISAGEKNLNDLPTGEREILLLIARQVLRAVSEVFHYSETVVELDCGGYLYTVKGKTVQNIGWKAFNATEQKETELPELVEGMQLKVSSIEVKEGFTKPPAHFTEDSLLSAMESAGAKDMPEDAERKGLGTPATRAGIIEKLVSTGFVERKKGKKNTHLVPANTGVSLVTVLPEQLQSPLLTAEWEHKLKLVEHGEMDAESFMREIALMVNDLVKTYAPIRGAEVLFPTGRTSLGNCPRCGSAVTESKKGFFCECNDCRFGLWHDNKYLTSKKISLSTKMVEKLLKERKVLIRNIFSERTGSSYDAYLLLNDDGTRTSFALDFGKDMAE